jgi:putative tricarboxylic transport membrane protein
MHRAERLKQAALAAALLLLGVFWAWAGKDIPSDAGYQGIGPDFLPKVVSWMLMALGVVWLVMLSLKPDALADGVCEDDAPAHTTQTPAWAALAWISAALWLDALLIERIGFVLACTVAYTCAARAFRVAQGRSAREVKAWLADAVCGFAISAPVYWLFSFGLNISLPALLASRWI